MAAKSVDKILLGAAATLFLASIGWMVIQSSGKSKLPEPSMGAPASYDPVGVDAPTVSTNTWPAPPAQSTGVEWVFEVFTPPEIYYYNDSKRFEVKRVVPQKKVEVIPVEPFGVKLVEVKPDVFRLQLVGYVGSPGDYRGNFENTLSGKTVIGRAGKEFSDLGLKVKSFEVKRVETSSKTSMTIIEYEAIAVVVDVKTGDEVTLTNKRRHIQGEPFAIFSVDGSDEKIRKRAGESFQVGEATYSVVNVTVDPSSATVRKESPALKEPQTEPLKPVDSVPQEPAPVSAAPVPSQPEAPAQNNSFPGF